MKRRMIFTGVIVVVLAAVFLAPYAWRRLDARLVGIHHQAVTAELARWENEYGRTQTWSEAMQAADMLEYVQHYYVPGPGYRSDEATEAELKAQRARTVQAIVAALKDSTGQDFGKDARQWREWIAKAGGVESRRS